MHRDRARIDALARREQDKYEEMWAVEQYAAMSPGVEAIPFFLDMAGLKGETLHPTPTLLDAGCGSGRASRALVDLGFDVAMADITDAGLDRTVADGIPFVRTALWSDLSPVAYAHHGGLRFDYVYCCDVLEHVPTEAVMLVLHRLLDVGRLVFLSVSFVPDAFGVHVGQTLHETVRPFVWWRDRLAMLGTIHECRDRINGGVFLVQGAA